jgi:hypothetical protein
LFSFSYGFLIMSLMQLIYKKYIFCQVVNFKYREKKLTNHIPTAVLQGVYIVLMNFCHSNLRMLFPFHITKQCQKSIKNSDYRTRRGWMQ